MKSFKIITYTSLFSLLFVCNIATAQKVDNQNDNSKEYKTLCQKKLDRERFGFKKGKASAGLGIARSSTFEKKDEEEVNRKIKVSPNSASNYGSRANLMIKKKNYKKALSDLNTAITIAPNQVS